MITSGATDGEDATLSGRAHILAEVEDAAGETLTGGLRVVLVTGAAGIGKTHLLGEVRRRFRGQATCLTARAYRWGDQSSLGMWAEALDRYLRTLGEDAIHALCGPGVTDLGALVKVIATATSSDPGPSPAIGDTPDEPRRHDLLASLVEFFDHLGARGPVLITLDDTHLADASSWEALRYLGRRLADAPIAVVLSARAGELRRQAIAGEVLLGLEEDGLLVRRQLLPLGRDEVARLAHEVLRSEGRSASAFVPEPLVTWLTERSLGHPLFIVGLVRALVDEGADPFAPHLEHLPEGLRDRVRLEIQGLSRQARRVLEALAVLEQRVDLTELSPVATGGVDSDDPATTPPRNHDHVDDSAKGHHDHVDPTAPGHHDHVDPTYPGNDHPVEPTGPATTGPGESGAADAHPGLGNALEELCAARLVNEHDDGVRLTYEVAHPIVADVVYRDIGGARRRALHRAAARALRRAGRLGSAAGHYARSAGPGDDEAVEALCAAMQQAEARGLYQEALASLSALLGLLGAGDPRWLKVLASMTWQAEWVLSHLVEGDAATAIVAIDRIAPHVPVDDHAASGTVDLHRAAFLSIGAGRFADAETSCRGAIDAFEHAGDDEQILLARNELAWIRGCYASLDEQVMLAEAVLDDAEAGGHARATVQAAGAAAYAHGWAGRFADAEQRYARSIEVARRHGASYRAAWGLTQRGTMLALAGQVHDGVASIRAALDEDPGAPDAIAFESLAHCHWLAGDLGDAVAAVEQSAARRAVRGSRRRAWAAALAARIHVEMGLRGRADRSLQLARDTYRGEGILVWGCWEHWTSGFLAWHDRDPARARGDLDRAVDQLRAIGAIAAEALVLVDVAEVAAASGEIASLDAAAGRLAEIAAIAGGGLIPPLSRLVEARSLLATRPSGRTADIAVSTGTAVTTGNAVTADIPASTANAVSTDHAARAAELAGGAAEVLMTGGYRLAAASARQVQGLALRGHNRAAALTALASAAEAFEACGARWRREMVLAEIGRLGSAGRRTVAALHGPGSLTERERHVARLAARGLTAREIGAELFIGHRTVESHLAHAYLKLGVTSKRELIRRAAELPLDDVVDP